MSVTSDAAPATYRDATRDVAERVEDLLARMTVEEKVAQLGSAWVFQLVGGDRLAGGDRLDPDRAERRLLAGIGQVTRVSGASDLPGPRAARLANEIQRFLVERTRLGIPAIVHEEICSGLMARDATIFPQAIGVAATWRPELAGAMADSIRRTMRALGAHQGLSPVLDVCRDPRWGRTEETFGEDPHLVARMGVAFVRGLQGEDLTDGVLATAKHFVGYGASEGGLNWAPAHIPARELREVYLHPFEAAVRVAGLRSVMNAYHELDGVPCAVDRDLLTTILRDEWGFVGVVVSDYFAVRQLVAYHDLTADPGEAAALALTAGLDVELPGTDCYGPPLLAAIAAGRVGADVLDTAVRRVLRAKFELGLFERPYVDETDPILARAPDADRDLAQRVAEQSLVLLRNDGVLPLAAGTTVAVIGPNADQARNLLGDYSYVAHVEALREMTQAGRNVFDLPDLPSLDAWSDGGVDTTTVLRALRDRLGPAVTFAPGCDVAGPDRAGFDAAVAAAAAADVAVLVMGDKAGLADDCTSGESRDRSSLDLPGVQEDLARAVLATGTPVVLVLVAGRPVGSPSLHEACAAVQMAWLPGQAGGDAIADALTGRVNPGGKLPISYPRGAGQVPVYYGHKVSGGRSQWKVDYVDSPVGPLYPFGYGLSYTTFALSSFSVEAGPVAGDDCARVRVTVSNTGDRAGEEVVQLYVRRPQTRLTRPVLELKGFLRVRLEPGQARTVAFEVPAAQVGFHDRDLSYVVDQGPMDILVGASSADAVLVGRVELVAGPDGTRPAKVFDGPVTLI
jgi:beta-glucosidase